VIGRRSVGITHPKLIEVIHPDFTDFGPVAEHFQQQDLAKVMVEVGLSGRVHDYSNPVLENIDIRSHIRALAGA
jgi:hypothetical protein